LFGTSWRVGRIAGIEVRVDSSWVVIALLITYSMYLRASTLYPELSGGGAVALGILATVLFFGSVLVHELAHALGSQARGIRVQDITLSLFGGATRARVESRGPGDEFLIALVGPLTSGLLAALFGIVASFGGDSLSRPLAGTLGYLGWVNLLLAAFNLVPGFPLDRGGCCARRSGGPPAACLEPPGLPPCPARGGLERQGQRLAPADGLPPRRRDPPDRRRGTRHPLNQRSWNQEAEVPSDLFRPSGMMRRSASIFLGTLTS
jgi:Zn-dependent protease